MLVVRCNVSFRISSRAPVVEGGWLAAGDGSSWLFVASSEGRVDGSRGVAGGLR